MTRMSLALCRCGAVGLLQRPDGGWDCRECAKRNIINRHLRRSEVRR